MSIMLSHPSAVLAFAMGEPADSRDEGGIRARPRFGRARMTEPGPTPSPEERAQADAHLIRQIAQGDKQALAELYDRFSRPLYATALRIVNDPTESQDIVHDAFVSVWEKAPSFDAARGSAFAWAVTLIRNRAIDRVRMRRRRSELLAESAPADLGYDETGAGAADAHASQGDDAVAVRAAVATLPAEQKRAVELAFFGGLTQQEIARKLAEPLGTVKARIRRGLLKLRDALPRRS